MLPLGLSSRLLLALCIVTAHAAAAFGQAGGPYNLGRSTIDGGGETSAAGGTYRVAATIGQPDAGVASGGSYFLAGGFWGGINTIESTPTPTVTGTVPSTPIATAPPSPTRTATTVQTAPTTPAPSITAMAATNTPSRSPTRSQSPLTTSTVTVTATASPTPTPPLLQCTGDCDESGVVTVDELVRGVNIALDRAAVSLCTALDTNADGRVTVNEVVGAVNAALRGC